MLNSSDFQFLEDAKDNLIMASINRVAHSGDMLYYYKISINDMKIKTSRQRIHESVIHNYISYFVNHGMQAKYNSTFSMIDIELNLSQCVLNPSQAHSLSVAMETFRKGM